METFYSIFPVPSSPLADHNMIIATPCSPLFITCAFYRVPIHSACFFDSKTTVKGRIGKTRE